jgi:hypothetical protein
MPGTMTVDEMNKLAQKLVKMRFNRAKGYVRGMDRGSDIELYRVAVGTGEWLTRYALPNKGLLVTLVEKKEPYGPPDDHGYERTRFKYVEARVEELPLSHRNDNEGNDPHRKH